MMESSNIILGLFFCLLCATRAIVLPKEVEKDNNSTESEEAIVKEVPQPEMTLQSGPGKFDYRLPGYYTFNNGEPFFVEKDPLTGVIDFTKKTTPTAVGASSTDSMKESVVESDSEYVYDEEETVSDQEHDEIDRKDSNVDGYRPNDIIKSPYKVSPDLHQFLNLPVHYSSSDKFPLISSSYANTKIQGSSGIYSNHKYITTSSTPSPSYYTFKQTTNTTPIPVTKTSTTTTTTTTTTARPSSTTIVAYTELPEEEYENPDDLAYSDYEVDEQFDSHHFEYTKTQKPEVTTKLLQITYTPSTTRATSTTPATTITTTNTPTPTTSSTIMTTTTSTTAIPDTATKTPTSTTEKSISIVTSLPLDVYYSSTQPEISIGASTTGLENGMHKGSSSSMSTVSSNVVSEPTNIGNTQTLYTGNQFAIPNEGYYHAVDEPFRPIYGPGGKPLTTAFSKPKPQDKHAIDGLVDNKVQFHKLPEDQSIVYSQRPTGPPKLVGVEPPKLDPPQNFYSEQPVKIVPGQHTTITFSEPSKVNTIVRPIQEQYFDRPERPITNKPLYPPFQMPTPNLNNDKTPQNERPVYPRPTANKPVFNNGKPFNQVHHKPEEVIYPQQRPTGVIPPSYATKPVSFIDIPPPKLQPHQPTKVESHFIKVSPDQENPSYSLQTSFSIGMPSDIENNHQNLRPGQGIGQVLLPDEEPQSNEGTKNSNLLPHRVRPPPNSRPPIQNYPLNRPGLRPPGPVLPQRPLPSRLPPPSMPDFRLPNYNADNYPRPHWESHTKPTFLNPQQQNALSKQDVVLPPQFPGLNRIKNENNQRYDLPNILPQFRPNAKVGFDGYIPYFGSPDRLREPVDTLQPPPLPSKLPQLRVNRNDEELEDAPTFEDSDPTQLPLVHRRTGAQASSRVTTLQMMKQGPPRRTVLRNQPEKKDRPDRPVFLVYPANSASKSSSSSSSSSLSEGVVVVGTRGPQKPVHPSNLKPDDDKIEDELDSYQLDDNKKFPIPGRERVDTPILKTKVTAKPSIRTDFPYAILKPEKTLPEERILSGGSKNNEYTAFSPTISSSTEDINDHDSEINIIPYLQDYMPFAIKRPLVSVNTKMKLPHNKTQNNQQISTSLNIVTTAKPTTTTEKEIHEVRPSTIVNKNVVSSEGSEFTVSAVMHTHIQQQQEQQQQQQQAYQHLVQHHQQKPSNHRTETLTYPKPLDFQAPFQASLSAPETQGWNVVKPNSERIDEEKDRMDTDDDIVSPKPDNEVTKFDFENFKPQLFGGFKPIIPPSINESEEKVEKKSEANVSLKLDREERKL